MQISYFLIGAGLFALLGGAFLFRVRSNRSLLLFLAGSILLILVGFLIGPSGMKWLSKGAAGSLPPITLLLTGWIGLVTGLQLNWKDLKLLPPQVPLGSVIQALPVLLIIGGGIVFLFSRLSLPSGDIQTLRVALFLGIIGISAAPELIQLLGRTQNWPHKPLRNSLLLAHFDRLLTLLGIGILYSLFHPVLLTADLSLWHWFGLTIILGIVFGVITWYFLHESSSDLAYLATMTGMIIIASGMAYYLALSPILITAIMGTTTANLSHRSVRLLKHLSVYDHSVFIVLLVLAGFWLPRPKTLMLLILIAHLLLRILGKAVGSGLSRGLVRIQSPGGVLLLPQGGLTIALALNQLVIFQDNTAQLIFQIVIWSSIIQALISAFLHPSNRGERS